MIEPASLHRGLERQLERLQRAPRGEVLLRQLEGALGRGAGAQEEAGGVLREGGPVPREQLFVAPPRAVDQGASLRQLPRFDEQRPQLPERLRIVAAVEPR